MDLLQGFRAALRALANRRLFAGGVQLTADTDSSMPPPASKAVYQRYFDVVFLDTHGWINYAADVSRSQLAEVRNSYHRALRLIDAFKRHLCRVGHSCTVCFRRNMLPD